MAAIFPLPRAFFNADVLRKKTRGALPPRKRAEKKKKIWYPERGSNPHTFRYQILSLTRLPIPPSGRKKRVV